MLVLLFILIVSAVLGAVCSVIFSPIVYFVHSLFIAPFVSRNYRKKGEMKEVVGKCVSTSFHTSIDGESENWGYYEYTVDGKTYTWHTCSGKFRPAEKVTLYYHTDPKKVKEYEYMVGRLGIGELISFGFKLFTCIFFVLLGIIYVISVFSK